MLFVLAIIGAIIGIVVNWCIDNLGDKKPGLSPWSKQIRNELEHPFAHFIPVIGWFFRRRDQAALGRRFWVRPLLIEAAWIFGLPLFYLWCSNNGLTGDIAAPTKWIAIWFVGHSVLIAFLFVATFIDLDQRVIPDGVTIPGTIIALIIAALWPSFRLPEVISILAGPAIVSVDFADAQPLQDWHRGWAGLGIGLAMFAIWILALLPKFPLIGLNLKSLRMVVASTVRFLQKNRLKVRTKTRRIGWRYLVIGAVGMSAIAISWPLLPNVNWDSLFGALIGLGFGGLMVWSVRIVASHSLGQEAMGFGDVTLMAMVGAFLGWQAALIVFALSPFAALVIVLVNYLVTRENEVAFGPYLCLGTLITIFGWSHIWPFARERFFLNPAILIVVLAGSLVLLMMMMLGVRILKGNGSRQSE